MEPERTLFLSVWTSISSSRSIAALSVEDLRRGSEYESEIVGLVLLKLFTKSFTENEFKLCRGKNSSPSVIRKYMMPCQSKKCISQFQSMPNENYRIINQ